MDKIVNNFISVSYRLYTSNDQQKEMVEEATIEKPYQFITGFGTTLEPFEKQIGMLKAGEEFNICLTPAEAYGEYEQDNIFDLDKMVFTVNGSFDSEHIFVGAIVPLQNEEGARFMAKVVHISDTHVKVDLNHPLAGKHLEFIGKVLENREATNQEIADMVNQISGSGCGCGDCGSGCGGCGGGCGNGCGC